MFPQKRKNIKDKIRRNTADFVFWEKRRGKKKKMNLDFLLLDYRINMNKKSGLILRKFEVKRKK